MKNFLKKTGWTDVLVSIIFAIIGTFMILKTDSATKVIAYIIGGVFVIFGIIRMANYFLSKGVCDFYNYDLVYGIVAIILGVITITCSNLIESMLRIMIGAWIIYSGVLRLYLSLKLHQANLNIWSVSLILSIIMIVCGIYMILQNGALVLTIGIIVLTYSIIDIIESIIFIRYTNELL